jgi:NAD(P)-dependent dehydrogenase (short-subunit alcohol dehydrogenase family)
MQIPTSIAVVTGAARGIGRAVSFNLAQRKVRALAMVDANSAVEEVAESLNRELGRELALPFKGDVTDPQFRSEVYRVMRQRVGQVTLCVPAAGITRDSLAVKVDKESNRVLTYPIEDFRRVLEVNLIAPVYWAQSWYGVAEERRRSGLKQWEPNEPFQGLSFYRLDFPRETGARFHAATKADSRRVLAT